MHNIPVRLVYEGLATSFVESPDLIAVPVSPMVRHRELRYAILDLNTWPSAIDTRDRATAVDNAIRNLGDHPFLELAPEDPPEQWNIRQHPSISGMWLVIDDEIDIVSSWPYREQAVYAAWSKAYSKWSETEHHALFRITLDAPPGYLVSLSAMTREPWIVHVASEMLRQTHPNELAAKAAAWQDYLANAKSRDTGFEAGNIEDANECGNWCAGIRQVYETWVWENQIEVYGKSEAEATELRDRILAFLQGASR